MTFAFNFTGMSNCFENVMLPDFTSLGTSLVVVGNDWRSGMAAFVLDGNTFQKDLYIVDSTPRCAFPWYSISNLAPIFHEFTMSIIGPSTPALDAFTGLQFFYYKSVVPAQDFYLN